MHAASYKLHTVLSENIRPHIYSHQLKTASNIYMLSGTNKELPIPFLSTWETPSHNCTCYYILSSKGASSKKTA